MRRFKMAGLDNLKEVSKTYMFLGTGIIIGMLALTAAAEEPSISTATINQQQAAPAETAPSVTPTTPVEQTQTPVVQQPPAASAQPQAASQAPSSAEVKKETPKKKSKKKKAKKSAASSQGQQPNQATPASQGATPQPNPSGTTP